MGDKTLLKAVILCWRDGSVVKGTGCAYRGPGFNSRHAHGGSPLFELFKMKINNFKKSVTPTMLKLWANPPTFSPSPSAGMKNVEMIIFTELRIGRCEALGSCCPAVCFLSVSSYHLGHRRAPEASTLPLASLTPPTDLASALAPASFTQTILHTNHSYGFRNCPLSSILSFIKIKPILLTIACVVSNTGMSDFLSETLSDLSFEVMSHREDCSKYFS